ncbi:MAG TPA: cytochrome c [Pirellulales bacterium]
MPASAACRSKYVFNNSDEIKVIVPFAVPVGVPVAPFAPYFYSFQQSQSSAARYQSQIDPTTCALPKENVAPDSSPSDSQFPSSDPRSSTPSPLSIVAAKCANCHGGPTPKAGLSLEQPESLNTADRIRAIHAVVTGQMPKGKRLLPDELQAVTTELSTVSPHETESSSHSPSAQSGR